MHFLPKSAEYGLSRHKKKLETACFFCEQNFPRNSKMKQNSGKQLNVAGDSKSQQNMAGAWRQHSFSHPSRVCKWHPPPQPSLEWPMSHPEISVSESLHTLAAFCRSVRPGQQSRGTFGPSTGYHMWWKGSCLSTLLSRVTGPLPVVAQSCESSGDTSMTIWAPLALALPEWPHSGTVTNKV